MIVYIGFAQPDEWVSWAQTYARHAQRFEAASGGDLCLVVPYHRAGPDLIRRLSPTALILSGFARSFQDYAVETFYPIADVLEDHGSRIPTLALCGGHQLLGFLFNGKLRTSKRLFDEPMRKRRPGEPITNPDYHPDFIMERGFYEMTIHAKDPLFEGCASPPVFYESHYCEVKGVPPGFKLLASTVECKVQAIRHESRPLIGVQFHPEDYSDRFPDGRRFLQNFFREAKRRQVSKIGG